MPLTSDDVRNAAFSRPGLGRRGYHGDEVDVFLELVASAIDAMTDELTQLRTELGRCHRDHNDPRPTTDRLKRI